MKPEMNFPCLTAETSSHRFREGVRFVEDTADMT